MQGKNTTEAPQVDWQTLANVVWTDPQRMGGAPCFYGTRVPVKILFDYIEGGEPLDEFLTGFPSVTRAQVLAVLEAAKLHLLQDLKAA